MFLGRSDQTGCQKLSLTKARHVFSSLVSEIFFSIDLRSLPHSRPCYLLDSYLNDGIIIVTRVRGEGKGDVSMCGWRGEQKYYFSDQCDVRPHWSRSSGQEQDEWCEWESLPFLGTYRPQPVILGFCHVRISITESVGRHLHASHWFWLSFWNQPATVAKHASTSGLPLLKQRTLGFSLDEDHQISTMLLVMIKNAYLF